MHRIMAEYTLNTAPIAFPKTGESWIGQPAGTPTIADGDTMKYTYKGRTTVYSYNTGKWTGPL